MSFNYRNFHDTRDLELQYSFWNDITKPLPWAWKPTRSPSIFYDSNEFNPNSRWFAFQDNDLVGYQSFTGKDNFVSIGYPWTLDEYKDEIRDELWDRIFYTASSEFNGQNYLQRFRIDWKDQIDYFLEKDFEKIAEYPLYVKKITKSGDSLLPRDITIKMHNEFNFHSFSDLILQNDKTQLNQIMNLKPYYDSLEFDYCFEIDFKNKLAGYFGITIRKDTKYGEINAFFINPQNISDDNFEVVLNYISHKIEKECEHLGWTTSYEDIVSQYFTNSGFKLRSADVYLGLELD